METAKLSTVKSVQPTGTFNSKFGLMYKFEYTFEDGTTMIANHKTAESFMKVGTPIEYLVKTDNQYGKSGSVGKPKEVPPNLNNTTQSHNISVKSSDVQDMIIRQSSVKSAIEYMIGCGSPMDISTVLERSEIIFEYCKSGKIPQISDNNPF